MKIAPVVIADIIRLAKQLAKARIASVLIDGGPEELYISSSLAGDGVEPMERSFFASRAALRTDVAIIRDATTEPLLFADPLVTGDPWIKFWMSVPLRSSSSQLLGTLAVMDTLDLDVDTEVIEAMLALGRSAARWIEAAELKQPSLSASDARYLRFCESAIDGILIVDPVSGFIIEANRFVLDLLGYSLDQIRSLKIWDIGLSSNREKSDTAFRELHETAYVRYEELQLRGATGGLIPVEFIWNLHGSGDSKVAHCVVRGISERKLLDLNVSSQLERAESSNRELESFAFVASHDLQEPLRKIRSFSQLLKERCSDELSEEGKLYTSRIQSSTERMQSLISHLLKYSRLFQMDYEPVEMSLNDLMCDVLSDVQPDIDATAARIEIGELPKFEADLIQMHQLMQNLISNALKFRRDDLPPVIRIYQKASSANLHRRTRLPIAGAFQLIVEDNGIGFDDKYAERIFTIFQRLHGRDAYEGTGIGLAICRKIAQRHGGSITATSKPGKGSTFTITLPYRAPTDVLSESTLLSSVTAAHIEN